MSPLDTVSLPSDWPRVHALLVEHVAPLKGAETKDTDRILDSLVRASGDDEFSRDELTRALASLLSLGSSDDQRARIALSLTGLLSRDPEIDQLITRPGLWSAMAEIVHGESRFDTSRTAALRFDLLFWWYSSRLSALPNDSGVGSVLDFIRGDSRAYDDDIASAALKTSVVNQIKRGSLSLDAQSIDALAHEFPSWKGLHP